MTKDWPGYPLPDGDLGQDEIVCQLVYLPNRDKYWQALYAAVHYMSTWIAWERDDDHRGKDAASNWREAFELTEECWRMACLDEITDRMDIMIDLLGNQMSCCGTTTIGPIITVVTNIVPGEGDDPTEWGETAVADWDEWSEYVCYHAHVYVDSLINSAEAIDIAIELGSYTIDFFTGVMQFLQYLGLDQVLGLNQVMMVYEAFRDENDLTGWFTPLAAKFEAAREDIVCAIMQDGSLSDEVEAAIDNNAVWVLFYSLTDYAAVKALIYEGTVDGSGYLSPIKRADCDCPIPEGYSWQDAEEIQFTLHPDTFGRINEATVTLPNIELGGTVANTAAWGCSTYPCGCSQVKPINNTYQTLAYRITVVTHSGNQNPYYEGGCYDDTPGYRWARYYTYDVAEGITEAWADTQSDEHTVDFGGHAKRAIGYEWLMGVIDASDSRAGQAGVLFEFKLEHLVWKP